MFFSVNKKVVFGFLIKFLIVFSVFLVTSCDMDDNLTESFADQDTYEARLDDAIIKMDKGQYQAAKDILDELLLEKPGDEYLLELRASCNVGLAGIDSLTILDKIDQVDDAGDVDAVDIVATILGDDNGEVTTAGLADILTNLSNALADLTSISNPTEDQLSQIALFSAYRLLANVANEFIDHGPGSSPLDLANIDFTTWDPNDIDNNLDNDALNEMVEDFNNMLNVPVSNALYDPLHELADGKTSVAVSDIKDWLKNLTN